MKKSLLKRTISIVCIILILFLVGCTPVITEGEVYDKEFRAAYSTTMLIPHTVYNGKSTSSMMMPYIVYYPDRYVIRIKAFQDEEWKTEEFYVSESVYDEIQIGDMFQYDEARGDLQDEPYTKERGK